MPELADLVMSGEEILKLPKFTLNLSGILLCQALQLCHGQNYFIRSVTVRHGPSFLFFLGASSLAMSSPWSFSFLILLDFEPLSSSSRGEFISASETGSSSGGHIITSELSRICWIIWICRDGCLLTIQFKTHAS